MSALGQQSQNVPIGCKILWDIRCELLNYTSNLIRVEVGAILSLKAIKQNLNDSCTVNTVKELIFEHL